MHLLASKRTEAKGPPSVPAGGILPREACPAQRVPLREGLIQTSVNAP
jgi:hypothetical protein